MIIRRHFGTGVRRRLFSTVGALVAACIFLPTVGSQHVLEWRTILKLDAKPNRVSALDSDPKTQQPDSVARSPLFNAIFFADDLNGCAAGDEGSLVCTTDGGRTWTSRKIDNSINLLGGFFLGSREGWVVGNDKGSGLVLSTLDGGRNWHLQSRITGFELSGLHAIWFADRLLGWTVGEVQHNGVVQGIILQTRDGGIHWRLLHLNEKSSAFNSIQMADAQHGWAVGHNMIMRTDDGGQKWRQQRHDEGEFFFDIDLLDSKTAWVVGSSGLLLQTEDGGASWRQHQLPSIYRRLWLASVRFSTPTRGWVAGNDGAIFSTKDGGRTWELESIGKSEYLRSLASTSHNVFAAGNGGTILQR